jgi:hypothetical protein
LSTGSISEDDADGMKTAAKSHMRLHRWSDSSKEREKDLSDGPPALLLNNPVNPANV